MGIVANKLTTRSFIGPAFSGCPYNPFITVSQANDPLSGTRNYYFTLSKVSLYQVVQSGGPTCEEIGAYNTPQKLSLWFLSFRRIV